MPYANHAAKNHGYNFDPEDYNEAFECQTQLQEYIDKGHEQQIEKKVPVAKSKQKQLVETPRPKVSGSVPKRRNRKV